MESKLWYILSRIFESLLFVMGIWSIYKQDWLWVFACFFGFTLAISPVIIKRNVKFSIPWLLEFLIVFAISLHVWGGFFKLYSLPFYDTIAHFLASAVVAFFALLAVYILDVFTPRIHMDIVMIGFFIIIFTIAIGAIWEIAEFASDQVFSGGNPKAQVSLQNTMGDLIADFIAGILVGVAGAIGIRRGDLKDILYQLSTEAKKLHSRFFIAREEALSKLKKNIDEEKVNDKILPIVDKINYMTDFFILECHSDKIAIIETQSLAKGRNLKVLGSWYGHTTINEIQEAIEQAGGGEIWFLFQPPFFQVSAISVKKAKSLLYIANRSGFIDSSMKSADGHLLVEIAGPERIDAPIGVKNKIYGGEDFLKALTNIANSMIEATDINLKILFKNLDSISQS